MNTILAHNTDGGEDNVFLGLDEYAELLTRLTLRNFAEPIVIALALDGRVITDLDVKDFL